MQTPPADVFDDRTLGAFLQAFYAKVRLDPDLGPVFAVIPDAAWPAHLVRIHDFWTSVMQGSRRYKGNPFAAHVGQGIAPAHFARWLALFEETAGEHFHVDIATALCVKAHRIAESLQAGLFFRPEARSA